MGGRSLGTWNPTGSGLVPSTTPPPPHGLGISTTWAFLTKDLGPSRKRRGYSLYVVDLHLDGWWIPWLDLRDLTSGFRGDFRNRQAHYGYIYKAYSRVLCCFSSSWSGRYLKEVFDHTYLELASLEIWS